ncbi:MAG: aspartate aminotransferase family protein [Ignavibacteriaceae bacterium]|nr:aspartate aminotransferase family protein [Ignavibacteriaceae bacterium]
MYHQAKSVLESDSALLKIYKKFPIEFAYGNGVFLYDKSGDKYLDFLSGIAVTGFGHSHPAIKKAVEEQLNSLWHTSNLFESSSQQILADKLAEVSGLEKVFFSNSGTEANEAAIKFARKFGEEKTTIITAVGSFHGRTMGSLSASAQVKLWNGFRPLTPGFKYVAFNDADALRHSITDDVCAVMLEPIQGEGGIVVPAPNYLKEVEAICKENNLLLILDEVQTGMGRTGKFFAHQWFDIQPDIITIAKGIANGLPLGATIISPKVAVKIQAGDHGSTFGGNPVSVAAAIAVMNMLSEDVLNQISNSGTYLINELKKLKSLFIKDVRGLGLMIGIEFSDTITNSQIVEALLAKKVVVYQAGRNTVRLLPPYTIDRAHISHFIQTFKSVLNDLHLE